MGTTGMKKPQMKTYIVRYTGDNSLDEKTFEQMLNRMMRDGKVFFWEKHLELNCNHIGKELCNQE